MLGVLLSSVMIGSVVGGAKTLYGSLSPDKKSGLRTEEEWEDFLNSIDISNKSSERIYFIRYESEDKVILGVPYGIAEHDIKNREPYFKIFMECETLEYKVYNGYLVMKFYRDKLPEKVEYDINNEILGLNDIIIDIGVSRDNNAIINFNKTPHLLIAGATGSGKSVMTHCILTQLYRRYPELKFYLADMKKVELMNYKNLKNTVKYVDNVNDVSEMVKELMEECDRRYELIGKQGCKKMETYNKKVPKRLRLNPIVFVVEECVRLVSDKQLQKDLAELLFIARACGIYVIMTIQRPTKACLSPEIKASLGNIIGLKTVNKKNSECICDDMRLKDLRGFGHGWLWNDLGEVEFQGYYIDEDKIDEYVKEL